MATTSLEPPSSVLLLPQREGSKWPKVGPMCILYTVYFKAQRTSTPQLPSKTPQIRDHKAYAHTNTYVYIYIHIYTHVYIYSHAHVCIYIYIHIHVYIYIHDIYIYTHIYMVHGGLKYWAHGRSGGDTAKFQRAPDSLARFNRRNTAGSSTLMQPT